MSAEARTDIESLPGTEQLSEKQRRVLEAALDVFAERGFHGASTSEIAKRAGVAEGTLFKQYKSKKELLIGALAPVFVKTIAPVVMGGVRDVLAKDHATVEDFLRALYTDRVEFIARHRRIVKIAMQELPFHDDVRALVLQTIGTEVWPTMKALIERFQREGQIRAGDPLSIVRIAAGTFFVYAVTRTMVAPQRAWDDAAEVELMAQVIAKGLRP